MSGGHSTYSGALWNMGRNAMLGTAEYLTPVLTTSQFLEKGVLTPDEFVEAGDQLVLRCPTWSWQAGEPDKARPFLPPNKQYLVTRSVPCQRRAASLASGADAEMLVDGDEGEGDEGWSLTHANHKVERQEEAPDMLADAVAHMDVAGPSGAAAGGSEDAGGADGAAGEAELEMGGMVEADDPSALGGGSGIVKTRTYDVTITYDKYYQSGRVWLYGYSESRQPLTQAQLLEDVSADHALKTVTLESHPHIAEGAGLHMSIHPCKHASVMHKLVAELQSAGREAKPPQYLFLFLKFISSVIPTIEYDYTVAVDGL